MWFKINNLPTYVIMSMCHIIGICRFRKTVADCDLWPTYKSGQLNRFYCILPQTCEDLLEICVYAWLIYLRKILSQNFGLNIVLSVWLRHCSLAASWAGKTNHTLHKVTKTLETEYNDNCSLCNWPKFRSSFYFFLGVTTLWLYFSQPR